MMKDVISECQTFVEAGGFESAFRFTTGLICNSINPLLPVLDLRRIENFRHSIDDRADQYLRWFKTRQIVPAFIPLHHINVGTTCVTTAIRPSPYVVHMEFQSTLNQPIYLFSWMMAWNTLDDIVRFEEEDLIGPCLNTSTVTLTEIDTCTRVLSDRYPERHCINKIFHLLIGLAAIYLWIADIRNFVEAGADAVEKDKTFANSKVEQFL